MRGRADDRRGALRLRPARPEDAEALVTLLRSARPAWLPDLHTREEDLAYFGGHVDRTTVAVGGNTITGFLVREGGCVTHLYAAPQGRGTGSALLDAAKRQVPGELELWVIQANDGARRFYARHGFEEVRRTDGDNEEGLPDVLLRRIG